MEKKTAWIAGIVGIFAIGLIAASGSFSEASGESVQKPTVPRYSETCAHGHNEFACNTPQHKIDISELQEKTAELEQRIASFETLR